MAPTTVIFDLDGVLVDSRAAIGGSIRHALAAHGLPALTVSERERFIGPPMALTFATLLDTTPADPRVNALIDSYRERYAVASLRETTVFPGIPEALAELAASHRLAVATSKPWSFAEPLLTALGLRERFEVVAGPELDARTESKARTLGRALEGLGETRAVMVGDRSFDIVGAHSHGLPAIGVTWGIGTAAELSEAGAEQLLDAPAQLVPAAAGLLRLP